MFYCWYVFSIYLRNCFIFPEWSARLKNMIKVCICMWKRLWIVKDFNMRDQIIVSGFLLDIDEVFLNSIGRMVSLRSMHLRLWKVCFSQNNLLLVSKCDVVEEMTGYTELHKDILHTIIGDSTLIFYTASVISKHIVNLLWFYLLSWKSILIATSQGSHQVAMLNIVKPCLKIFNKGRN